MNRPPATSTGLKAWLPAPIGGGSGRCTYSQSTIFFGSPSNRTTLVVPFRRTASTWRNVPSSRVRSSTSRVDAVTCVFARAATSAGFTALAGALYAMMVGFIDPDSGLGILISVEMLIMAALGGAGTLFGPLLGALILVPLRETTNSLFGGGGTGLTYMLYGGIILLLARFRPGGLIGIWHAFARRRRARDRLAARPRVA